MAALRSMVGSTVISVGLSLLITGAMSWLFHGELRPDMLATGFVAGALVNLIILRIVKKHRQRLRRVNSELEHKVAERTAELRKANEALEAEMQRRADLQEQLMVVDRMATAGQLAAGISHEIRNPLTLILANVPVLEQALTGDEDLTEALEDIADATSRVARLATDLTTLSKPYDDPLGPVALDAVVASAARLAAHQLRRGSLTTEIDAPEVKGHPSRLCQVFLNLFINAAKAARKGERLAVVVQAQADEEADDVVKVTVTDNGTGMPPETLGRVWDSFFTTRGDEGGTGLGLPMVRSIVEAQGGSVSIESTEGEGTTVTLLLPVAPSERPSQGTRSTSTSDARPPSR